MNLQVIFFLLILALIEGYPSLISKAFAWAGACQQAKASFAPFQQAQHSVGSKDPFEPGSAQLVLLRKYLALLKVIFINC